MRPQILQALSLAPIHREDHARTQKLSLDDLIDQARVSQVGLSSQAFDLLMMAYRSVHLYEREKKRFLKGRMKPKKLSDLWLIGMAALLTRTESSPKNLVFSFVEFAKERFGPHPARATNAFLREFGRNLEKIQVEIQENPELLLGEKIYQAWKKNPLLDDEFIAGQAKILTQRPDAGIACFDSKLEWKRRPVEALKAQDDAYYAIEDGSWHYLEWLFEEIQASVDSKTRLFDACSAPGGKLIATLLRFPQIEQQNIFANDAKFGRLTRLKDNLAGFGLGDKTTTTMWQIGKEECPEELSEPFDIILADLPCLGSGTLYSRPDILLSDFQSELDSICHLQKNILKDLKAKLSPGASLLVSICSLEEKELDGISDVLGMKPQFLSPKTFPKDREHLVAWHYKAPSL